MSRVGKLPVEIPQGVQVSLTEKEIVIKGKLGELRASIVDGVNVLYTENKVSVTPANDTKESKALWGTYRNNIKNMVKGVSEGFEVRLEMNGVGYRSATDGKIINLVLGFSHEIRYAVPAGINVKCEKPTLIVLVGAALLFVDFVHEFGPVVHSCVYSIQNRDIYRRTKQLSEKNYCVREGIIRELKTQCFTK
jgi:large subunit ribosomal protein L6